MKTDNERSKTIKAGILEATEALMGRLRTSYGPKGLDKMILSGKDCTVTNDGATILKFFKDHPVHNILADVSRTQDVNCGDGTTSVVLLICSIFEKLTFEENGRKISKAMGIAKEIASQHIDNVKVPASDIMSAALTALNSKIANKNVNMAKIAIEALANYEMRDIKIYKRFGGNIDDISIHKGIIIPLLKGNVNYKNENMRKVQAIQFCISAPKTNMDSKVNIKNYKEMEKFVEEEKEYLLKIINKIKETGTDLIIVQKSLLRESVSVLGMHLLKKAGIDVIDGIERSELSFLCDKLKIQPCSDISFIEEPTTINLKVIADERDEYSSLGDLEKRVKLINIEMEGSCTIIVDGIDQVVVDESVRSLNDVLCVIKSLNDDPFIVPGGCAIETGIGVKLEEYQGDYKLLVDKISEGFLEMTHILASNAGYYTVDVVNKLKIKIKENWNLGISMRKEPISDMLNEDNVLQPSSVTKSAILLALETVEMLLKIDDMLPTHNL